MTSADTEGMGDAVENLRHKVELARVTVPPHVRVRAGKVVRVEGYTYDREGGKSAPSKPKPARSDATITERITTTSKGVPVGVKEGKPMRFNNLRTVEAYNVRKGRMRMRIGVMRWDPETGVVREVDVDPDWQRQGVASAMYAALREIRPDVQHSPRGDQTDAGAAWAGTI